MGSLQLLHGEQCGRGQRRVLATGIDALDRPGKVRTRQRPLEQHKEAWKGWDRVQRTEGGDAETQRGLPRKGPAVNWCLYSPPERGGMPSTPGEKWAWFLYGQLKHQ